MSIDPHGTPYESNYRKSVQITLGVKPVQVTDEMVRIAHDIYFNGPNFGQRLWVTSHEGFRKALEAALAPPEEIPVSDEMSDAGCNAIRTHSNVVRCGINAISYYELSLTIYRAMEAKRREEESEAKEGFVRTHHTHVRHGQLGRSRSRKTDAIAGTNCDDFGRGVVIGE